jgi:hypothetical protein
MWFVNMASSFHMNARTVNRYHVALARHLSGSSLTPGALANLVIDFYRPRQGRPIDVSCKWHASAESRKVAIGSTRPIIAIARNAQQTAE